MSSSQYGSKRIKDVLEALGARRVVAQVRIARIVRLARIRCRRPAAAAGCRRSGATHELLLAVLGQGLRLVLALQGAVVALVQAPAALDVIQPRSADSRAMLAVLMARFSSEV